MTEPLNLVELKEIKGLPIVLEQIAVQAQCVVRLLQLDGTAVIEQFGKGGDTSPKCLSEGGCREIVEKWRKKGPADKLTCFCGNPLTVFPINNRDCVDGVLTVCPTPPNQEIFLRCFASMISNCLGLARNAVELWSDHHNLLTAQRELFFETESLTDVEAVPEIALRVVQKYLKADVAMYLPRSADGARWGKPFVLRNGSVPDAWLDKLATVVTTSHDQDQCPLIILGETKDHYPQFVELMLSSLVSATVICEKEVMGRMVFCSRGEAKLSYSNLELLQNLGSTIGLCIHDLRTRQLKERFFETALHQIRTPAHSVLAIARLLANQKAKSPKEVEGWLQDLTAEAERMARLTEKAGEFSLLQKPSRQRVAVSLNKLVEDVARRIRPLSTGRQVSIETALPEETYEVVADEGALYLALQSLVENALKFSPFGGSIQVVLAGEGEDYKVSVIDQGPGVPESQKTEIFKELVSIARAEVPESTGMGLAIARAAIDAHNGTLACHDVPGKQGTCFSFTIPQPKSQ